MSLADVVHRLIDVAAGVDNLNNPEDVAAAHESVDEAPPAPAAPEPAPEVAPVPEVAPAPAEAPAAAEPPVPEVAPGG